MKKLLVSLLMLVLISSAVWAGPFVKFDLTLPQTASLSVGIKTDELTLGVTVDDLFFPSPPISFDATYVTSFGWWGTTFDFNIENVDVYTHYPIPVITNLGFGATTTMHIASLVASMAENTQSSLASNVFDIYVGINFEYSGTALVPKANIGFYWEY